MSGAEICRRERTTRRIGAAGNRSILREQTTREPDRLVAAGGTANPLVLDVLVQKRRDKAAAVKLMRKLLRKQGYAPSVLVTDKLRSYSAAKAEIGLGAHHEQGLRKNTGGELAPAGEATRAKDAAVQVAWFGAAVPLCSLCRLQHLQRPAPSYLPPHSARLQS